MTGSKFFTIAQELAPPTERGHLFAKCIATSQMKANRTMLDCTSWLCESRTGPAGSGPKMSGKPMFLTFPHRLSREGDPNHHFHNILINTMECTDGKYRAIDLNPFFKNDFLFTVGQFYRDQEARFLNEEFAKHGFSLKAVPYEITNGSSYQLVNHKGEIIPEIVTSHFSKRSQQIDEELAQQGIINPTSKQRRRAAHKTRKPKQSKGSIEEQRTRWRIEVGKLGFSLENFCPELTLAATVERSNKPVGKIEIKPQPEALKSLAPEVSSAFPEEDEFQPDQKEKSIEFGPEASSEAASKGLMPILEEIAKPEPADGEPSSQHQFHKPAGEITFKPKSEVLEPLLTEASSDSAKADTKSQLTKKEKAIGPELKAIPEVISVDDTHQVVSPLVPKSEPQAQKQMSEETVKPEPDDDESKLKLKQLLWRIKKRIFGYVVYSFKRSMEEEKWTNERKLRRLSQRVILEHFYGRKVRSSTFNRIISNRFFPKETKAIKNPLLRKRAFWVTELRFWTGQIRLSQRIFHHIEQGHKVPRFGTPKTRIGINLARKLGRISRRQQLMLLLQNGHIHDNSPEIRVRVWPRKPRSRIGINHTWISGQISRSQRLLLLRINGYAPSSPFSKEVMKQLELQKEPKAKRTKKHSRLWKW